MVGRSPGHPHPRPVWGIWTPDRRLLLSVGSPGLRRALDGDPRVTVHLDSGTDVVIVEGTAEPGAATDPQAIEAYNLKYDWDYRVDEYGDLLPVRALKVLAWRCAGPAGRGSFQATGSWVLDPPPG